MAARKGTEITTPEIGETFGAWSFLGQVEGNRRWLCVCVCGAQKEVNSYGLRKGLYLSCGCARVGPVTHGKSLSKAYRSWGAMLQRCVNPKNRSYGRYGGAGVRVCQRWRSFENFYADMGEPPSADHTIERLKNSLGYSKVNCTWSTRKAQNTNRKNTVWIEAGEDVLHIADWAKRLGIHDRTLRSRLSLLKWPPARALGIPGAHIVQAPNLQEA